MCLGMIRGLAFAVSSELKQIKTGVHSSQFLSPSAPSDVQRHWSMERDLSGSTSSAWHVCVSVCLCVCVYYFKKLECVLCCNILNTCGTINTL